jgi:type II secretory pathway pseudopilin PulG
MSYPRPAFTLKELLIVIAVLGGLFALTVPAIQSARESSRCNQCRNNLKQIGIALLNYEVRRHALPPISSNIDSTPDIPGDSTTVNAPGGIPGADPSPAAGYSWMVYILAEFQHCSEFQALSNNSQKFTLPALSPLIINGDPGSTAPHISTLQFSEFQCPSFSFGHVLDVSPRTVGTTGGNVETGAIPPNYLGGIATANGGTGIGITNYNAILGTHIDNVGPAVPPFPLKSASLPNSNNGGMKFRGASYDIGFRLMEFTDGTAHVPLVAETRERRFSSWYDGTMNWVVATRHSMPAAGTTPITAANTTDSIDGQPMSARWVIGTDGTTKTGGTALNYGPTSANPTAVYLPTGALTDPDISSASPGRLWGPSSLHKGGIVNHVFADAHVDGISDAIYPNVYLWFVTRNGGEAYDDGV